MTNTLPTEQQLEEYFDRLWPLCRSITGQGLRQSLGILTEVLPLEIVEVPSGAQALDWVVPNEWNIEEAFIEDESGRRILDFRENNLHVLGYSAPVDTWIELSELEEHLYSDPALPNAIPYVTSYYKERWGFCIEDRKRKNLKPGRYHAVVRSTLKPGSLTYGHCILPATTKTENEILISTYLCHPSMANNELSGPLVAAFLYRCLQSLPERRFNYRFVFVPETIGSIVYLEKYGQDLISHCHAGFVVTCCGDENAITYKKSRRGNAEVDRCVSNVLKSYKAESGKNFSIREFFPTGSDERQYCSPGYNLPVGSLMRSMYGTYPEYHTSLDNKSYISFSALRESVQLYLKSCLSLEKNRTYKRTMPYGEPKLGSRGLYPTLGSVKENALTTEKMMFILNYSDGSHDLCAIAEKANCSLLELADIVQKLEEKQLISAIT